jgi:hypothetical protein
MANQQSPLANVTPNFMTSRQPSMRGAISCDCFTYSSLDGSTDGLRLLILEPSRRRGDIIRSQLKHVTFGEMPKYEALSYTWGSDDAQTTIVLDGKRFSVRDNLWDALDYLRLESRERTL